MLTEADLTTLARAVGAAAKKLERHLIGVELQPAVASRAWQDLAKCEAGLAKLLADLGAVPNGEERK